MRIRRSLAALGLAIVSVSACLDRPLEPVEPRTTSVGFDVLGRSSVASIDLLLVVDNSGSMADKQDILKRALPRLVARLVQPVCVDGAGVPAPSGESVNAEGLCPEGLVPEFAPVRDIHIGLVSSSLGAAGADTFCTGAAGRPNDQDFGRLIWRTSACGVGDAGCANDAPTWEGRGFLAWDPGQEHLCPGESPGGAVCPGIADPDQLIETLGAMVEGVGEYGCGYEAPLEAAYRFLLDPHPWASIDQGVGSGEDEVLLAQRADFLRPDSLLAVILLTDENDCSLRQDVLGDFLVDAGALPRPRAECATDPDDPCCRSCIEPAEGCSGDGGCEAPGCSDIGVCPGNFHTTDPDQPGYLESDTNTRCHDGKRRFGIDFLYPVERYVNAFSRPTFDPEALVLAGDREIPNPLFTSRPGQDTVYVGGIVGVPWQLIARKNEAGEPDLERGFQTFDELEAGGVWPSLVPDRGADFADDPHMIESRSSRPGLRSDPLADPWNGNEWTTDDQDLQYACIFDLPEDAHRECTQVEEGEPCDCFDPLDKPLCEETRIPGETGRTRQERAKGYPGTRLLQVLQGLGEQGITASICPAHLALEEGQSEEDADFGYTPAVLAIVDRLKEQLGGSCQARELTADREGNVPCLVIEARDSDGDADTGTDDQCTCDADSGRRTIGDESRVAADAIALTLRREEPNRGFDCLCEVVQLAGSPDDEGTDRWHCQNDLVPPSDVNGWCYVDATSVPPVGAPELFAGLFAHCPPTEQRLVRFVNGGAVTSGAEQYITCAGE